MDSLDLTLRLGMSSNEDEQPQLPPTLNADGAFNMTQGAFGSGVSGNVHAGQYSGISITEFQRSVSLAHTYRREHVLPPPAEMKEYCVINVSNRLGKVGGSRRRKATLSQRPVPEADENRSCTNFNCRVKETPMWRRGPLGSKTLCNACGIKYRKLKLKEEQGEGAAEGA
ncbi:hypothetical protein M0R45_017938 [Rubus argutus]|uniref:GATA-type domain-containing protein n=1 Tax=Rubus argutus TaxID=59490 RepID=A0AAW1XXM2_RUBAR